MHIAQVSPLYEAVPPTLYGGTERVVAALCDALICAGHEVTLFASGDSATMAQQVIARPVALRLDSAPLKSDLGAHLHMLAQVKKRSHHFDILHFHTDLLHFPMFERETDKTVTTVHGRLDIADLPLVYARWPRYGLVSVSDNQRAPLRSARWLATVPHGLPVDRYRFEPSASRSYLAFLGRLAPEKRPELAIRLASRARIPLRIAAKVDATDRSYFETVIRPMLADPLVEYIGEISDAQKADFLGHARALLFPIDWPEPFGLVMIEAMACGTPVIAWNCGSVPEVIDAGRTGYIVSSEEEALQAIEQLDLLDSSLIRATFERRFAANVMAEAYGRVYNRLLSGRLSPRPRLSNLRHS
jgi:glycosyltransferase involved in cell wall biosynthesis